jgi:hypothetical protein
MLHAGLALALALGAIMELRRRPMSREHARPHPPAASHRHGGRTEEPAPVPVGVPATEPSGPGAKLDPPDHTQPSPAPL